MTSAPITNSVALVVDDDQSTCDVVATILEQEGFTVVTANSGEQALGLFGEFVFDIVFTDVFMNGISGLELLERVGNLDSSVKIVIMTAFGGYDTVVQALKSGAHDYLEKPLEDHSRVAAIARKAYAHAMLERDNTELLTKLKASHKKLANANSKLLKLNETLETLSITDPLTGLKNRRYIEDALQQEFARHQRYGSPFCVMIIDVDHFKNFNDEHGHAGGDEALKTIASLLQENARGTDTVGRLGGEEFVLMLSNTSVSGAEVVATRILRDVANTSFSVGERTDSLTISIGVACAGNGISFNTIDQLFHDADAALYLAKAQGRNRVVFHEPPDDDTHELLHVSNG